jgi:hypothetical protein
MSRITQTSGSPKADPRVRAVVVVAILLVVGALVLDMSGRAVRTAGSDHIAPVRAVATLHAAEQLCQAHMLLPADVQSLRVLARTGGVPLPALSARFVDYRGRVLAAGFLPAGARPGSVTIALRQRGSAPNATFCLRNLGSTPVALLGEPFQPGSYSETVAGRRVNARVDVTYQHAGSESWWQLLGTLSERFGLGKARVFGDWTLAAVALLLLAVWAAAARLLLRELR